MEYITRKGGATVTVFVPYDCSNNCPFCINKAEYSNTEKFNIEEIIRSIKIMSAMTPECDFVFTGGEPLEELHTLERLINTVHSLHKSNHKVFINTTIPVNKYSDDYIATFLNEMYVSKRITGINVSRHLRKYVQERNDSFFQLLTFKPRINCVLYGDDIKNTNAKEKLKEFVERFIGKTNHIQFRKDYVVTTPANLYDKNDEILNLLKDTFEYVGLFDQYRMRCGYEFKYKDLKITYHKTLPYSKIYMTNNSCVLYDVIIKQDGTIKEDWDTCLNLTARRKCDNFANELDLSAYRKVKFERYV